ncbi:hypothetical protein DLM78_17730 [Leptospira stimsonii]|uniref:Uncharacterized protein n=1 Tax=Leptospira stimsonii TaxID=2202203 RepID=A0A8B3CPU1_9LEPT|nr:hypothetical protein DLM78_17730 [Leptospira stimsonii]
MRSVEGPLSSSKTFSLKTKEFPHYKGQRSSLQKTKEFPHRKGRGGFQSKTALLGKKSDF